MHTAFGTGHHHRPSRISVNGDTDIQLLGNISLFGHQDLANFKSFYLFSKEFSRQIFKVFRSFGNLNPPGQTSPAHQHLGFKNHRVSDFRRNSRSILHRFRNISSRHRDLHAFKNIRPFIFMESHSNSCSFHGFNRFTFHPYGSNN